MTKRTSSVTPTSASGSPGTATTSASRPASMRPRSSASMSSAATRVVPAGHAIAPTGGHLDPTMFQAFAPHIMPLTVEEGIADGISEVRKAVRYQIKHGAQLIKVCASGGVMSHTGPAGAQQYSDAELAAIADEAHRAGLKVAAHAHGDDGIRAAIEAGIDCIEHGSLMSDETLDLFIERGTFLVATTYLADGMDLSHADAEL